MNLQDIPTSLLIAWDARVKRDLEVFVPTFVSQNGEPAQTWRRQRRAIRDEIKRREDDDALRELDGQKESHPAQDSAAARDLCPVARLLVHAWNEGFPGKAPTTANASLRRPEFTVHDDPPPSQFRAPDNETPDSHTAGIQTVAYRGPSRDQVIGGFQDIDRIADGSEHQEPESWTGGSVAYHMRR